MLGLWSLDTLQLALVTHAVYTYTVTDFANPVAVLELPWYVIVPDHILAAIHANVVRRSVVVSKPIAAVFALVTILNVGLGADHCDSQYSSSALRDIRH